MSRSQEKPSLKRQGSKELEGAADLSDISLLVETIS